MQLIKFIDKNYVVTHPYASVISIKEYLLKDSFLIVLDHQKYIGILTPEDVVNRPHKLVIDCLAPKTVIQLGKSIKEVILMMQKEKTNVKPVFKGETFLGIVTYEKLAKYLAKNEMQNTSTHQKGDITKKPSSKVRDEIFKTISHEIRTPLNAIVGFSDLLVCNNQQDPKNKKFSEVIKDNTNDLLSIINDLIEISKIRAGEVTINKKECRIDDLFFELYSQFTLEKKLKGKDRISFEFKIPISLKKMCIYADEFRLKQVLSQLIRNAFKFTEGGKIEFGCKLKGNKVVFYVSDTGIGIPEDKKEFIFESFVKLETKSRIFRGTGLGLSITKGIVELMGGEIWVENGRGNGSIFCFSIPYKVTVKGGKIYNFARQ